MLNSGVRGTGSAVNVPVVMIGAGRATVPNNSEVWIYALSPDDQPCTAIDGQIGNVTGYHVHALGTLLRAEARGGALLSEAELSLAPGATCGAPAALLLPHPLQSHELVGSWHQLYDPTAQHRVAIFHNNLPPVLLPGALALMAAAAHAVRPRENALASRCLSGAMLGGIADVMIEAATQGPSADVLKLLTIVSQLIVLSLCACTNLASSHARNIGASGAAFALSGNVGAVAGLSKPLDRCRRRRHTYDVNVVRP